MLAAAVTVTLPDAMAVTLQDDVPSLTAVATAALLEVQVLSVGTAVELPPVTCTAKINDSPMFIAALLGVMITTTGLVCTGTVTSSPQAAKPPRAAKLAVSNAFFREKKCILPPSFEVVEETAGAEHNTQRDVLHTSVCVSIRRSRLVELTVDEWTVPGSGRIASTTALVTSTPTLPDTDSVR